MEDTRNYFADTIEELNRRRRFADVVDDGDRDPFEEAYEEDPSYTQEPCPSKPFEGLEQCLSWHTRIRVLIHHGYTWLRTKLLQEEYPSEGYSMNTGTTHQEVQTLESRASTYVRTQVETMDKWERTLHREWSSLVSRNLLIPRSQVEGNLEGDTRTSKSIQTTPAFEVWNAETLPRGTVVQRDRQRGRVRLVISGEFIPDHGVSSIAAINVGTLKASTSDEDTYCMLDSGVNVMVVPWVKDMKGERTMCSLVGDNKTPGLIVSLAPSGASTRKSSRLPSGLIR